jgi:hypothetical protein
MDYYDFVFPSGQDLAAPPPMGEFEMDEGDYNMCYPIPMLTDHDQFSCKPDEEPRMDNTGMLMFPELYPCYD